eukprot:SAG31_NODE_567_length_14028_cov_4.022328_11_plen_268_part_00
MAVCSFRSLPQPDGFNEKQWIDAMEREHCGVKEDSWGKSEREWTTGNYGLQTTPRKEWRWVVHMEWEGQVVSETPGAFEADERGARVASSRKELVSLRRRAMDIDALRDNAPALIFSMLDDMAKKDVRAVNDDGVLTQDETIKKEEIRDVYANLGVNKAELIGLRLYTGPMFEFYNTALRARGGKVPWGNHYPLLEGEDTSGRFVTSIHSINSGIIKLSALTPVVTVCRGASGRALPEQLETANKFGSRLGIEFGCVSPSHLHMHSA